MKFEIPYKINGHTDKPNLWFINWYAFFMAFPSLDLLGFSVTFYLFILLIYHKGTIIWNRFQSPFPLRTFLFLFLIGAFISTFLGPVADRPPPLIEDARFMIQHVYWITIAAFFICFGKSINMLEISKYLFWGIVTAFVCFYFLPEIKIRTGLIGIVTRPNRNGVIYSCLAVIPFSFYYIQAKLGHKATIFFLIAFNLGIIFTEGRSGTIVFLFETLLIVQIIFPLAKSAFKVIMLCGLLLYGVTSIPIVQPLLMSFANVIEPANPRVADLIRGENSGNLEEDRSWLIRLVMIEKAMELYDKYPIFGVGVNHFKAMDGSLRMARFNIRLQKYDNEGLNETSAHNSYIMILAENGLWGLICVIFLAGIPIITLISKLAINADMYYSDLALAGLFGIAVHWYTIASFMGGITWLMIALAIFAQRNKF